MTPQYEIRYCPTRDRKGLQPYALFAILSPSFSRGLSQHATRADAEAALSTLLVQKEPTQ